MKPQAQTHKLICFEKPEILFMFLFPLESCENYGYGLTKSSSLPDHKKKRSKTYHHRKAKSEKEANERRR